MRRALSRAPAQPTEAEDTKGGDGTTFGTLKLLFHSLVPLDTNTPKQAQDEDEEIQRPITNTPNGFVIHKRL
jgi:hypothetical protein